MYSRHKIIDPNIVIYEPKLKCRYSKKINLILVRQRFSLNLWAWKARRDILAKLRADRESLCLSPPIAVPWCRPSKAFVECFRRQTVVVVNAPKLSQFRMDLAGRGPTLSSSFFVRFQNLFDHNFQLSTKYERLSWQCRQFDASYLSFRRLSVDRLSKVLVDRVRGMSTLCRVDIEECQRRDTTTTSVEWQIRRSCRKSRECTEIIDKQWVFNVNI